VVEGLRDRECLACAPARLDRDLLGDGCHAEAGVDRERVRLDRDEHEASVGCDDPRRDCRSVGSRRRSVDPANDALEHLAVHTASVPQRDTSRIGIAPDLDCGDVPMRAATRSSCAPEARGR
jgi:hypothetical protein